MTIGHTLAGTYMATVTLTTPANNPLTVLSTGTIVPTGTAGLNGGLYAMGGASQAWTITNSGLINDGTNGHGIRLGRGGTYVGASVITNLTGGTIIGRYGIDLYNGIASPSSIVNQAGATIAATENIGVYFYGAGTLTNSGVISAPTTLVAQAGVSMEQGGTLINSGTGIISGYVGVTLSGTATVTNAGTIEAANTAGLAVGFDHNGGNRLIVDPGAVFVGRVAGGTGTLELASAASVGTLSGFGTSITNFSTLAFDGGAAWTVVGNASASGLGGITITGFGVGDTIDVTGFAATSETFASNVLTLTEGASHETLIVLGSFTSGDFQISTYNSTGTSIVDCFAAGTRIGTPTGNVFVEDLVVGALVSAHFAGAAPVQWIGRRDVDCAHHPRPRDVWPVRVSAGAFGPATPSRDLLMSPNHGVYIGKALIPVRLLINDTTIVQIPVDGITYYHVELPTHDLLSAEGMLAESYLDAGDRSNFANGGEPVRLHPDFATRPDHIAAVWEMRGCAPLVLSGPQLDTARLRTDQIARRSGSLRASAPPRRPRNSAPG
jgi:hypothetical protein